MRFKKGDIICRNKKHVYYDAEKPVVLAVLSSGYTYLVRILLSRYNNIAVEEEFPLPEGYVDNYYDLYQGHEFDTIEEEIV